LGLRVLGFEFWVLDVGFRVLDLGLRVLNLELRVLGFGFWVLSLELIFKGQHSISTVQCRIKGFRD
jgi:hypothetical protein